MAKWGEKPIKTHSYKNITFSMYVSFRKYKIFDKTTEIFDEKLDLLQHTNQSKTFEFFLNQKSPGSNA